jgi:hypothetical protein
MWCSFFVFLFVLFNEYDADNSNLAFDFYVRSRGCTTFGAAIPDGDSIFATMGKGNVWGKS